MARHSEQDPSTGIHPQHRYAVADAAARLALGPLSSPPLVVGSACLQQDTQEMWDCVAVSPSIVWKSRGGGGAGAGISSATPQPLGSATPGSTGLASDAGHVHALPTAAQVGAATAADIATAFSAHAAGDPHPQYVDSTELSAALAGKADASALAGKENAGVAAALTLAHEQAGNPHAQYAQYTDVATLSAALTAFGTTLASKADTSALTAHTSRTDNPHSVTAAQVGAVPTSRQVATGNGLAGGGELSADRTLSVAEDADGSISVGPGGVRVGVLATDGQHGTRGGGSLHAAATISSDGFMTAAQASQLAALATLVGQPQNLRARLPSRYEYLGPGGTGTLQSFGCAVASLGSVSTSSVTNDVLGMRRRIGYTSAAAVGSIAELRAGGGGWVMSSVAGVGGFVFDGIFRLPLTVADGRWFFGMNNVNGNATNIDPLADTIIIKVGLAANNNAGNVFFVANNGASIHLVDTGIPQLTTSRYRLTLVSTPGSLQLSWVLRELISGASASGTTPLGSSPQNGNTLFMKMWACNNTTASAVALGLEYMDVCSLD